MAKLEGVKVLDMKYGEILRVEYNGEIYEKVDGKPKIGDIGRFKDGIYLAGKFEKVKDLDHDGDPIMSESGSLFAHNLDFYRKISVQPSLADRVTAVEAKLNDLSSKVDKLEGKTDDGYRLVTDREPRVGDYVKFDEALYGWLTAGKYYEIKEFDGDDPVIIRDDGDEYDTFGDEFKVYEKVPAIKETVNNISVGDYVKLTTREPSYGWGGVKRGDIGKVVKILGGDQLTIEFPNHPDWSGLVSEVEKVTDENELKFLRIGRKPNEYKVGDLIKITRDQYCAPVGSICEVIKIYENCVKYRSGYVGDFDAIELIAPVEARVDHQ